MAEDKDKNSLDELKEKYSGLHKKFDLPNFDKLNEDFSVEKVPDETDFLLREMRRIISEKIFNYVRFLENLIQPVNVPLFVFSMVKSLDENDKKKLSGVYKKLSFMEIDLIKADIEYSEESEAKLIKKFYDVWNETKKDLISIFDKMDGDIDSKTPLNERNYFG